MGAPAFHNIVLTGRVQIGQPAVTMRCLKGKPVILRQLEYLGASLGTSEFVLAADRGDLRFNNYIHDCLAALFKLKVVTVDAAATWAAQLLQALEAAGLNLPVRVFFVSILCPAALGAETDLMLLPPMPQGSRLDTLPDALSGGAGQRPAPSGVSGTSVFKPDHAEFTSAPSGSPGCLVFADAAYLRECCVRTLTSGASDASAVLRLYQSRYPLKRRPAECWYDLNCPREAACAAELFYNTRAFNAIRVDSERGVLIKSSAQAGKLEDEAYWYAHLPEELKIYAPRLVDFRSTPQGAELTQELYGYPSLQEFYLSGELDTLEWQEILRRLFALHRRLCGSCRGSLKPGRIVWLYYDKTLERLRKLKAQHSCWDTLLSREREVINGREYRGLVSLLGDLEKQAQRLGANAKITLVHGDYCFSNILFDSRNYLFKLVDPRGSLAGEQTIYGDPRYDLAKLRHSVAGLYDFMVQGLFTLTQNEEGFEYRILCPEDYSCLVSFFDECAAACGYSPAELRFIEGLLFLSMLPLHQDSLKRQLVFYLRAVERLNEALPLLLEETRQQSGIPAWEQA